MRWLVATIAETIPETARATHAAARRARWPGHRAGQHVDVRLTAEDGYQAQRSYSIASAPGTDRLELTVVRIDDGEVSPYLATTSRSVTSSSCAVRSAAGSCGTSTDDGPLLLVGGGSGVVPLMAMLRHHARVGSAAAMHARCTRPARSTS